MRSVSKYARWNPGKRSVPISTAIASTSTETDNELQRGGALTNCAAILPVRDRFDSSQPDLAPIHEVAARTAAERRDMAGAVRALQCDRVLEFDHPAAGLLNHAIEPVANTELLS